MLIRRTLLGAGAAAPMLAACSSVPALQLAQSPMLELPPDPHSYAKPAEARVTHVSLDLTADFTRKSLLGTATLTIAAAPGASEIVLDVDNLTIRSVRAPDGAELHYAVGARDATKGSPLAIALPLGVRRIVVAYETSPQAGALQWLDPAQTASNKPFMFSQGESILTRSWIPTQDSPGIRQTYDARIVAPEGLRAVMSSEMLSPNGTRAAGGRAYRFRMRHPIPPYLIAVAVGDLEFRSVGPRTGVWAEPSVVQAAAYEFADMERMMEVAEALYGPYRWGRYDVLVLPPSFPYGGMENPRLTFATPTVLAGDRSLVSLIAHELAHSWSGNLVTNAVWADFWLNEGFTSYIESRIVEALYGADRANMARVLDWAGIQTALRTTQPDAQRLHLRASPDPENYNSAVAYDKGALFLRTVETAVGRDTLDAYLRSYFTRFAFKPMTSEKFLEDFRRHVVKGDAALEASLQLDRWVYEPGLPSNAAAPHAAGFDRVTQAVNAFNAGGPASAAPWSSWGTLERQRFLQTLPRRMPRARLDELERTLRLNETGNSEVLFDWFTIAVENRYDPSTPAIETFLTRQGRRKFVLPIYRNLMAQGAWGQAIARRIYARARASYHPVTAESVDRIVTPA